MIDNKITRFGYIIKKDTIEQKHLEKIKSDLKVAPQSYGAFAKSKKINYFKLYKESKEYISIPKYYGIEKIGVPLINKLDTYNYPVQEMNYIGNLRPRQKIIVDKTLAEFNKNRGGIIVAGCGIGKTNMAIYIACHYKIKTLFIVHKTFLKDQIINRIKSVTNVQKVGVIQQKKTETEYPFVVGMVQSLSTIKYDDNIFKDFGMVIIDEVHHMGARNFSKVYSFIGAKYMLGISAEKKRNDGLYKIINWYMGPIIHSEEQSPNEKVIVKKINYATSNKERSKLVKLRYTGEYDRSTMITNLIHIKRRNRFILDMIKVLFAEGKNILVLSGRLNQVKLLYSLLIQDNDTKDHVGKYIGGMSDKDLNDSKTKRIILGTYSMAEEGLDIENLNVVLFATPKSNVKQPIGRILRKDTYEENPIVIDIVDIDNDVFKKQSRKRETYYKQKKYNIQEFNVSDYDKKNYLSWDKIEDTTFIINKKIAPPNIKTRDMPGNTLQINIDDLDFID